MSSTADQPKDPTKYRENAPNGYRAQMDNVWLRRAAIASLVAKQLSLHEIRDELARQGIVNPKSGQPWSIYIISTDLKELRLQWMRDAKHPPQELRASQLQEIRQLRKAAWASNDRKSIIAGLKLEMQLTGTLTLDDSSITIPPDVLKKFIETMHSAGLEPSSVLLKLIEQVEHKLYADVTPLPSAVSTNSHAT